VVEVGHNHAAVVADMRIDVEAAEVFHTRHNRAVVVVVVEDTERVVVAGRSRLRAVRGEDIAGIAWGGILFDIYHENG
jgi:hypothetical protein